MIRRFSAALVAAALVSLAPSAFAQTITYDFSDAANAGAQTPTTVNGATFSSPGDLPGLGAYTFGPNAGLFSNLGPYVLSSDGVPNELDITFAVPQIMADFNFALGDFFASTGDDSLVLTTNTGATATYTAGLVGGDLYPEGSVAFSSADGFTSLTLTSTEPLVLADLTTQVPEPASMALLGAGLFGLAAFRRRARG